MTAIERVEQAAIAAAESYSEAGRTLHEFVPFPLFPQACARCSEQKRNREVHYQARDRRRPKVPA